ncbi:alpha-1,2-fucosyltransferase [Bacteroides sp. BFG-638]|uniref:alpha-1,2-fucosyltransferase n=1 Tax=Bacteroides TaxID=816 RepID=UPI002165A8F4|nr:MULTISPECIES: alpha-1,2-fucosyltransferase [unclassified Bacteroides]MCS2950535.1 alpha-1,2-fucosyltransferase [Bacteroides sp. BFG-638]MCS3314139.1 alpha-1,2-fucosyltransferase [Bacteroides sp. BFG-637]
MKIVNILGGLGNQMFVYAMYLALKEAHPEEEILLCRRSYKGYPLHNGYELERIFGVEAPEAALSQLARVAYPFFNYKSWQLMRHFLPLRKSMASGTTQIPFDYSEVTRNDNVYYDGYWQNEKNFLSIRDKVIKAFTFPEFRDEKNKALSDKLKSVKTASCHIRRGDYLKDPIYGVCNSDYYTRAITELNQSVNPDMYCIFSDDIGWCKENFKFLIGDKEVVFVDWNKGQESFHDMQLMSLCHYNIIANSSFSWWGAWLNNNDDKVVVAPERWMNKTLENDPICDNWKRIKVE